MPLLQVLGGAGKWKTMPVNRGGGAWKGVTAKTRQSGMEPGPTALLLVGDRDMKVVSNAVSCLFSRRAWVFGWIKFGCSEVDFPIADRTGIPTKT